jgi:hypothetical protein
LELIPGLHRRLKIVSATIALFLDGQNQFWTKVILGQSNEQQRHYNKLPFSGEENSIQNSLQLLFNFQLWWNVVSVSELRAAVRGGGVIPPVCLWID